MDLRLTYKPETAYHQNLCSSESFTTALKSTLTGLILQHPELETVEAEGIVYFPFNAEQYMGHRSAVKNRAFVELLLHHPSSDRSLLRLSYQGKPFVPESFRGLTALPWASHSTTDKLDLLVKYLPESPSFKVLRQTLRTPETTAIRTQLEHALTSASTKAIRSLSRLARFRLRFSPRPWLSSQKCPYCNSLLRIHKTEGSLAVACSNADCSALRKFPKGADCG